MYNEPKFCRHQPQLWLKLSRAKTSVFSQIQTAYMYVYGLNIVSNYIIQMEPFIKIHVVYR